MKPVVSIQPLPPVLPLPEVRPLHFENPMGQLQAAELLEIVQGLEPGWYTTALLHPRYRVWAENNGRRVLSKTALAFRLNQLVGKENIRIGLYKFREYRLTEEVVNRQKRTARRAITGQQPLSGL